MSSTANPNNTLNTQKQYTWSNVEANTYDYNDTNFEKTKSFLRACIMLHMQTLYSIAVPIDPVHRRKTISNIEASTYDYNGMHFEQK